MVEHCILWEEGLPLSDFPLHSICHMISSVIVIVGVCIKHRKWCTDSASSLQCKVVDTTNVEPIAAPYCEISAYVPHHTVQDNMMSFVTTVLSSSQWRTVTRNVSLLDHNSDACHPFNPSLLS